MKYMGSKARLKKEILPLILKNRKPNQYFVDLMAGGMNVIDDVDGNRIANDLNGYLIELWKGLILGKRGFEEISKDIYDEARKEYNEKTNLIYNKFEIAWIGFIASANGRFYEGGYSGISKTKIGTERNYIKEAIKNIEKQIKKMEGVVFLNKQYFDVEIPKNSIVYFDPPYKGTKQYSEGKNFDYEIFYDYVRKLKNEGHQVFVSEYEMPSDFVCIWEKEVKSSLSANGMTGGSKSSIEKLFTL
jgi:DNA adenine methylase